jgi:lipid II:glycine glycyltransferase (peptidoglycan interpeptide bridge formation enzyme)
MSVQILNPFSDPQYDDLLRAHSDYSFFHSASWARVISQAYNYQPRYFAVFQKAKLKALLALMEIRTAFTARKAVSLPFTDYCDTLSSENINLKTFFDKVLVYGRQAGWKTLEVRGEAAFKANELPYSAYYVHELELPRDPDRLFPQFRSSTRRNIKKATKCGVTTKICHSLDAIRTYYRLHCATRKHHGVPPQPFYFFKAIYDHVISTGKGFVVLSSYNAQPIAGAVYFHFGQKAVYKYGASNRKYLHIRANNQVMWTAIKWYIQNGFESFSFGRTDLNHSGLLQFKRGWATQERIIRYFKYDLIRQCFVKERPNRQILYSFFRRLPESILILTGRLLYRYMG